ncbi:uncharacterized protein LOC130380943 [Gadus chalcogrammus]|uniref:uncharacterized protein LOC130380943 n=1 Tax=Gadus chalcogrammus TaxID=1042646 RepID=UPI0024C3D7BE|nr:uncharacterized protein LOC130380943 [Gadus chalcogrammus]
MFKVWRIQRIHILRGCLSDPEVEEGILYRYGGTLQLNYTKGEGAAVPVWIPVRGTSQQEGFHCHQAQWVTGNRVSTELFQAQAMTGVVRWNFQRLVDLKQPGVELPAVFDPLLIWELNAACQRVTGVRKYPALHISNRDTGERFGLQYVEPGCRPVVLNWDKHRTQHNTSAAVTVATQLHSSALDEVQDIVAGTDSQETSDGTVQDNPVGAVPILSFQPPMPASATAKEEPHPLMDTDLRGVAPLPISSSPRAARTGPIKTGGLVQVLDHGRWTAPMRAAIDGLLAKHHGAKALLKRVDEEYAAMVQRACTDPNSLLHPTTGQHISRYVKHLAKLKNTSSSLNTSPEKVLETAAVAEFDHRQQNSVCTRHSPASCDRQPSSCGSPPEESLSRATVEKIVSEILQKQQQQPRQERKVPRNCLSCGQPKSRELEAVKRRSAAVEEGGRGGGQSESLQCSFQQGRLCRFCHQPLKQGPVSPSCPCLVSLIIPGNYILLPFPECCHLYKDKGNGQGEDDLDGVPGSGDTDLYTNEEHCEYTFLNTSKNFDVYRWNRESDQFISGGTNP